MRSLCPSTVAVFTVLLSRFCFLLPPLALGSHEWTVESCTPALHRRAWSRKTACSHAFNFRGKNYIPLNFGTGIAVLDCDKILRFNFRMSHRPWNNKCSRCGCATPESPRQVKSPVNNWIIPYRDGSDPGRIQLQRRPRAPLTIGLPCQKRKHQFAVCRGFHSSYSPPFRSRV